MLDFVLFFVFFLGFEFVKENGKLFVFVIVVFGWSLF